MSTGDLKTVVSKISQILQRQRAKRLTFLAEGKFNYGDFCENSELFSPLLSIISPWALRKLAQQLKYVEPEMPPCTGVYTKISGPPCKHVLQQRITDTSHLQPADFHKHWWLDPDNDTPIRSIFRIRNPDVVSKKRRARRANAPQNSTQRGTIAVEREERRLRQLRRSQQQDTQQDTQSDTQESSTRDSSTPSEPPAPAAPGTVSGTLQSLPYPAAGAVVEGMVERVVERVVEDVLDAVAKKKKEPGAAPAVELR